MRNALPLALIIILAACQSGLFQSSATPFPPRAMSSPALMGTDSAQGTWPPTVQPSAAASPQAVDLRWDTSPTARIIRYYSPYTTAGLAGAYNRAYYIPEAQVWGDGRIIWVSFKGSERRVLEGQLTTDQMEALLQRIAEAGFFTWQDEYDMLGGNSYPPMRLAVSLLGQSKEVQEHGGAPEAYYELAEWLSNGAGASGIEYVPRRGYLTARCWPDIEMITPETEWPDAVSGFTLDQVGNGRYIENEVLAFAWQVVNQNPRGPVNVTSNNHDCVIMVQIPGVSFFEPPPPPVSTLPPTAISLSDNMALNIFDGQSWRTYTTTHGLVDDYVTAIAIDPAGHKWVGTHNGLSEFDGQSWRTYTTTHGLADNRITAIAIDPAGRKWVGTPNGLSEFDGQSWRTYTTTHGLVDDYVTTITVDPAGPIWVGTYGGVSKLDGQTWHTYTTAHGLAHNGVNAIAIDPAGHKWFATFGTSLFEGTGVSEFDDQTWRTYTTTHGLAHNWVNAIAIDAAGHKWFGTEGGGVSKFDGATWTTYTAADGLASNVVYAIELDQAGHLWFGTSGGMSKFDGTTWTTYTRRDGLPYQRIHTLAIDQDGRKWFGFWGVHFFIDIAGAKVFTLEGAGSGVSMFDDKEWTPSPAVLPAITAIPVTSARSFSVDEFAPRLIDDGAGRIYTLGWADGVDKYQILVLALADEQLLAVYDIAGGLALDEAHGRLYVDQYNNEGLAVLNTRTGRLQTVIFLPQGVNSLPQADPVSGQVMAFRDNVMYLADPESGAIVDTAAFEVINTSDQVAPIERSQYDPTARLLYLTFIIHGCTSSMSGDCSARQAVVYDIAAGREIACDDSQLGTVVGGYMYCDCRGGLCQGWGSIWGGSRLWFDSTPRYKGGGRVDFDPTRQLFYEVTEKQLRVFDAGTLALTMALPRPITGTFERYHAKSDTLQFRVKGQLQAWPASAIRPPAPEPLAISAVPTTPVQLLAVSPGWPADPTLFGAWLDPTSIGDYNRQFACNTLFYISRDSGQTWGQPRAGLAGSCGLDAPTLAVSPDYARDQTLLAGVRDLSILKSTAGGQLWLPSGVSLPDRFTREILLSPGFADDETAFAKAGYHSYRSTDGGRTWQALSLPSLTSSGGWQDLALSPEFDQDQTLMSTSYSYDTQPARVYISHDGGDQWEGVSEMPGDATALSLAPLFAKWQTVFAYGAHNLYRSADGGHQWEVVLTTEDAFVTQLVHAPDVEQNRPMFMLVVASTVQNTLPSSGQNRVYRSNNEGLTWQAFELPAGVTPTALAISPNFAQDQTLFIGDANGRVLTLEVTE